MTDFYSVLKDSIVRRNLRSPDDRREVYEQARKAMIRRLWSFDPPLAEEEIDTRIGLFDAAVERIESDLELAFAEVDAIEPERPRRREAQRRLPPPQPQRPAPQRPPLVYEGYDEEADYAPAFAGRTPARQARESAEERQPPAYRAVYEEYEEPPAPPRRYEQRAEAARPQRQPQQQPAFEPPRTRPAQGRQAPPPRVDQWTEPEEDFPADPRRGNGRYEALPFHEEHYEEAVYEEPPAREPPRKTGAYQAPKYRQDGGDGWQPVQPRPAERWSDADPVEADDQDFEDAQEAYEEVERAQPKKKKKARKDKPATTGGRNPVRILAFTIAILSVVMIGFSAYVFVPLIMGPDRTTARPATMPPKLDDRVPGADGAAASSGRIVADGATASEISERDVRVAESLVVFDGRDPTVFEGSPDNPIRFASDAEGEYAQISSASSAAGARAVIGPGLAERLAGRTIRVTLLARSSAGNGAANLRFAYQSGVAISHWQAAQLTGGYGTYGMIWRVPAGDSRGGDYLLIEPGIPGDGTSTDIRSIRIDILAS